MENKIDFVITWVDGSDKNWQNEKEKYSNNQEKNTFSDSKIRYRDLETLKYWFRGVEKYANWVNKIYFVTCNQKPKWLNENNKKLVVVNHEDFIPKEYLPTFNSNTIEMNLHRINGLSEQFVYFNDDCFLINNAKKEDFFKNGKPCETAVLDIITAKGEHDNFEHIILNNMEIINKHFNKKEIISKNKSKWFNTKYGMQVIRTLFLLPWNYISQFKQLHISENIFKSTYNEIWEKEFDELNKASLNKFRSKDDYNPYLIQDWQIAKGNFEPRKYNFGKMFNMGKDDEKICDAIINQKYKEICINDNSNVKDFEETKKKIIAAFEKILPEKSSFEK